MGWTIAGRLVKRAVLGHRVVGWKHRVPSVSGIRLTSTNFKHQEIEGPTVERDTSALAEETRSAVEGSVRALYGLSRAAAALGLVNLGVGAWAGGGDSLSLVQSVGGFAFPMSMALIMRRCLKPIVFFNKMELQGRLQILTLTLQALKSFDQMFQRLTVVAWASALALALALAYLLYSAFIHQQP